jgi:hypothetical protein
MFFVLKSCPKKTLDMTSRSLVGVLLPWCWLPPNSLHYSFVQGFSNEFHIYTTMHSKFGTDNLSGWHQYSCTLNRVNVKILSNIPHTNFTHFWRKCKDLGYNFFKVLGCWHFYHYYLQKNNSPVYGSIIITPFIEKKIECTWVQNLDILEVPLLLSPNLSVGSLGVGVSQKSGVALNLGSFQWGTMRH